MNWQIIELENGSVALVREDEQEPILTIGFSPEARERLSAHHLDVAAAMIGAGMEAVDLIESADDSLDTDLLSVELPDQDAILH
jgi:hypothetical protein